MKTEQKISINEVKRIKKRKLILEGYILHEEGEIEIMEDGNFNTRNKEFLDDFSGERYAVFEKGSFQSFELTRHGHLIINFGYQG